MKDTISRTEIPLPNDLPTPAYLTKDPAAEELLKQNQDLMARMTVSLRRVGELELQIRQYQERIQNLKQQNQAISESSHINRELLLQKEDELKQTKEVLHATEKDYAKLYTLHSGDVESYQTELREAKTSLQRHVKFRTKVQEKIKPYIQDLMAKNAYLQGHIEELEKENHLLQSKVDTLIQDKKRVENYTTERIENLHAEWQIRMEHAEEIISLEKEKNNQLQSKARKMQQRMTLLENIDDEYTLAKNRAIAAERSRFELERKFEEQVRKMQQTIIEMRDKQQQIEIEKNILKQKLEDSINLPDFSVVSRVEQ